MAALNFPSAPTVDDLYTANSRTWKWNGESWVSQTSTGYTGSQGAIGYTGSQGVQGVIGYTGSLGATGPGTSITTTADVATASLYLVMVGTEGSAATPKSTSTKTVYDASTGALQTKTKAITEVCNTTTGTGTKDLNLTLANVFDYTMTGNTTFTISNPAASGVAHSFTLILRQDGVGGRTVTWPASVKWTDAIVPVISTAVNAVDVFTFFTVNGGTFWFGTFAMASVS